MASPEPTNPQDLPATFLGKTLRTDTPDRASKAGRALVRRRWSQTPAADREAVTAKGRDAIWQKFLDAVPESVTDPVERTRLAREARRSHMSELALRRTQRAKEQ